jgi:ureidoacrylate peracid hydrolase
MEALVVVDMQNCFAEDGGLIFVKQAKGQVPYIKTVVEEFKATRKPVIYLGVVWDSEATIPTGLLDNVPPIAKWDTNGGLKRGTWGARYVSPLDGLQDHFVEKKGFDGFHDTELDTLLRRLGVDTVYIVGTTANNCVYATALGAFQRGYRVVALREGISSFTEEDRNAFLGNIKTFLGAVK